VKAYNAGIEPLNAQVLPVLEAVTTQKLGTDKQAWVRWWTDERGYVYEPPPGPKPTFVQQAEYVYQPNFVPVPSVHSSCFGIGTPVRTLDGSRPIETLKIGDVVLTQDPKSGALSFEPVLRVFHNPPAATLTLNLGGESIVTTPIHRFWRAGKGWSMARELEPGDILRTLGGTARIVSIT